MLLTLFLLGLLYVVFIGVLLVGRRRPRAWSWWSWAGCRCAQLFFSDKLALSAMGAKEVSPQEAPGLHAMIERLCIQADLPKPRIAVADTDRAERLRVRTLARRARPCAPPPGSCARCRRASSRA